MLWEITKKRGKKIDIVYINAKDYFSAKDKASKIYGFTGIIEKAYTHRDVIFGDYPDELV